MAGLTQFAKPDVANTGTDGALEMSGSLSHSKSLSHGQSKNMTASSTSMTTESAKLYVRNLPSTCGEEDLRTLYSPFGQIASILMTTERAGTGYCSYVTFVNHTEAHAALKATHGTHQFGSSTGLNVRMAESLESRNNRLSRKAAAQQQHQLQQSGSAQLQPVMGSLTMSGQLAMSGSHNSLGGPTMVAQPIQTQQPIAMPMSMPGGPQMVYVPAGMVPVNAQQAPLAMPVAQALPAGTVQLPPGMIAQPTMMAPAPQTFQQHEFIPHQ